jgi:hypothetical protein
MLLLGVALIALIGCDSGPKLYRVTGTVYWNNEPISKGSINFIAEDGKTTPASATIKDGKYELQTTAGPKKIEVHSQRSKGYDKVMKQETWEDEIPDKYHAKTELRFEVKPSDDNVYDLKLPMK